MTFRDFNLAICVPATPYTHNQFWISVMSMIAALSQHKIKGYTVQQAFLIQKQGSILPQLRHQLVREAMSRNATHVLFVDSDQTFPAQLVHALARHNKQVIGCNVATKQLPANPTARNFSETWVGGDKVYTKENNKSVEQVWRLGFGVMLIDIEVFKTIPAPWFNITYNEAVDDYVGEDWFFCEQLQKHNIPIFIDHDASWRIGHIGPMIYTHEMVEVNDER